MSASRKTLSGIVGVDAWKTTNKALLALISALVLFSSVVAPGVASAEPEVPSPTPIPTVEVPAAPPAQQDSPPAEAPAPAPPPAPAPVPPPVEAPPPQPPVVVAPAPAPEAPPPSAEQPPVTTTVPAPAPPPATRAPAPEPETTPPAPSSAPVPSTTTPPATTPSQAPSSSAPPSETTPSPSDSPTSSRAESPPQQPADEGNDSGSEQQAPADQGTPSQPNESEQGTPPAESETSTTATTSPTSEPAESSTPVVEEAPVAEPVDVATQEGAKVFSEDALVTDAPVEGQVASEETVAAVDDAILAAAYGASDRDPRDRDNDDRDGKGRHNNDRPRDHDPKGWKCDDRRGAYGCPWNDWHHDDRGRPVFNNQFTFDLKVVYFDGFNRVEVIVRAGTRRPINTPGSGAYAFVVVGVSNPNFAVNVGVGVFNSDSNCNRGCGRPATTQIGVVVNVSNRNVYYPNVGAYDCGCGVTYGNRYYDRIYVGGTREVIGNWVEPQGQPRYFQPWGYKESPASPAYVQGTPPEFAGYGKLGVNPDGSETTNEALPPVDTTNQALQIGAAAAAVVLVLGIGGLLLVQRSRRNRRVNEP